MDLNDALGGWPGGNPGQPANPTWPGQPSNPSWPAQPGQPGANPAWPGGPGGGGGGAWPSQPTAPGGGGAWPGGPSGGGGGGAWPSQPSAPGGGGAWPGGPSGGGPSAPGGWPSPAPGPGPAAGGWPSPAPGPGAGHGPGPGYGPGPVAPQINLKVPFQQKLPNGVFDKLLITLNGTAKPNAQKFNFDLSKGLDIAFHFIVHFNEFGKKAIGRNSLVRDKWGKEERELGAFPFKEGQPFEMKILCTSKEFRVAVNNSHVVEFRHRITDLRNIDTIGVYHDVTLTGFNLSTV